MTTWAPTLMTTVAGPEEKGRDSKRRVPHRNGRASGAYQFRRAPKRITRGATRALMRFALLAFWRRLTLWTMFELSTLNTSAERVIFAVFQTNALSIRKSTLWKAGRRFSPW